MKNKKILILSHSFYPDIGGIETVSEILATEFCEFGHVVRVVTKSTSSNKDDFPFEVIKNPNFRDLIKCHLWADVILENNLCVRLSWPVSFLNKSIVTVLQTWIARPNGKKTFVDKLKRIKLSTSKAVIAISNAMKTEIFDNSIVIPNPFNSKLFLGKNINFERNSKFVFLGRLVSDKGTNLAIDAIAKLVKKGFDCNLVIIGDGPDKYKLKKQVQNLGLSEKIEFKGSLTEEKLVEELCKHKYMLVPSIWKEPFGIVALEGLACGCIPIVSDGGGLPDAVGKAGLVFERNNLSDLTAKMELIMTDKELEIQLKNEAKFHLKAHFPKVVAKKYLDVLLKYC